MKNEIMKNEIMKNEFIKGNSTLVSKSNNIKN